MKKCVSCGKYKDFCEFPKRKDSPDGYRNQCKQCRFEYKRKWDAGEIEKRDYSAPEGMKICRKCERTLSVEMFGRCKQNKDGLKSYCKDCMSADGVEYCKRNKDHIKEYRDTNKERIAEKKKEYYERNKEDILKKKKEYYDKNKEALAKRKKEWYKKNKHKVIENKRKRREREYEIGDQYSVQNRLITLEEFGYRCFRCESEENLHIDHHRPLVKGNALSLDNAVVLCKTCNSSKGPKDPEEFYGDEIANKLSEKLSKILEKYKGEKNE